MTGVLRWETPPPARRGEWHRQRATKPDPTARLAEELRARPGHWGVIFEGPDGQAGGLATKVRGGRTGPWQPAGVFDAVTRSDSNKTIVYARYVGGGES